MSARPVMMTGVIYPMDKMHAPMAVTFVGNAWDPNLSIGGGPVPPQEPVDPGYSPPWARPPVDPGYSPPWARPIPPHPAHPIELPPNWGSGPPTQPPDPPNVGKPPPPDGGWGWHPEYGWGYFPGGGGKPQPPA